MRFEWDSEKNRFNQLNHGGIAFESAALVFDDPHVIFRKDRIVSGEQRCHAIGAAETAVLLVVHVYRMENENGEEETIRIASRPAKLISVSAEYIFSKPLGKRQKAVLSRIAKRQAAGDDFDIDYSDIPRLTDEQLAQFRRTPKVLVAARIDREVYDWLMQYGEGYSTRINRILRTVMERAR